MSLNSRELRTISATEAKKIQKKITKFPIYFILENVLDTYNIGGFFRLAEAVAAKGIYLCGGTETPPNPKITKASIGTYKLVSWKYKPTALAAITELKKIKNLKIIAVEQSENSQSYRDLAYKFPLAFIFGHESFGITSETLALADAVVELPMFGINKSLNVMVAAGISVYWAIEQARRDNNKLRRK